MTAVTSKFSWFQQNYDKVILVLVLLGLLGSAIYLVMTVQQGQRQLGLSSEEDVVSQKFALKPIDTRRLQQGFAGLTNPTQARVHTARMFVSETRVYCVKCGKGIEMDAPTCPFCGDKQPPPDPRVEDSDGDGMSDNFELRYRLDPSDPDDARLDTDGDGFSNIEEMTAETDPTDRNSHPSVIAKLRLARAIEEQFALKFMGVQQLGETEFRFQLNVRSRGNLSVFAKMNQSVEGYTIDKYDKATDTLTVSKGARLIRLVRNKDVIDDQLLAEFVFLLDGKKMPVVRMEEEFTVRDLRCRLIEVLPTRDGAKIVALDDKKEHLIPRISPEESSELQNRLLTPFELRPGTPGAGGPVPFVPGAGGQMVPNLPRLNPAGVTEAGGMH